MQRHYFGTDGVRGPVGGPVVNEAFFSRLGSAVSRWLEGRGGASRKVLIGRDTRGSGEVLVRALGAGLACEGMVAVSVGTVPTPAVARAVRLSGAALGAEVTASHNPASDNGVKFFGPDGSKLSDEDEAAIEALIGPLAPAGVAGVPDDPLASECILTSYIDSAAAMMAKGSLKGWKVALDTANGATCVSSPAVFRALGADLEGLGDRPDGLNINLGVGSENPAELSRRVISTGAKLGVAHDGDGDRCVLCDELGHVLDGDEILTLLAVHLLSRGELVGKTLVVTVQSNLGVDRAIEAAGGRVLRSSVGDRYVAQLMRQSGASLGGESSGHIVNFKFGPTGDGLVAALMVARVMIETGRPLSALRQALAKLPQATTALRVKVKKPLETLPGLSGAIEALRAELGASGRVLVRYSGTESKLRFLVEAPSEAAVRRGMDRLTAAARAELELV